MLKIKIKKGFTLIEVVCSLAIFSIIIVCIFSIEAITIRSYKDNLSKDNNILAVEAIKNHMIYNMSYENITSLRNSNDIYIHKENLNLEKISQCVANTESSIKNIFTNVIPTDKPHITLSFVEINNVFEITVLLTLDTLSTEKTIKYNFYKGNY